MTSVRISVQHPFLGDVEVNLEAPQVTTNVRQEKAIIQRLAIDAVERIRGAYKIGEGQTR